MVSGVSVQVSEKREPQPATSSAESNTEQGIMNVEGKENFIIGKFLFDIQDGKIDRSVFPAGRANQMTNPETTKKDPR